MSNKHVLCVCVYVCVCVVLVHFESMVITHPIYQICWETLLHTRSPLVCRVSHCVPSGIPYSTASSLSSMMTE
jgi:hypothetical protein